MKIIEIFSIIILLAILFVVLKTVLFDNKKKKDHNKISYSKKHLNELSFLKFAKFYGYTYQRNDNFYKHVNTILNLVNNKKEKNIKDIANQINYDLEYTFMLIRYLKNKRLIGDISINRNTMDLIDSSYSDKELINKYSKFIYDSHLQIDDMVPLLSNKNTSTDLVNDIIKEIVYLDKKYLLNGIRLNIENKEIIYYSVEKKKLEKAGIEVVVCPKCGAITYKRKDVIAIDCDNCKATIEKKIKNDKKQK